MRPRSGLVYDLQIHPETLARLARARFDLKCAYRLQHHENHVIEKDADTNNNHLS